MEIIRSMKHEKVSKIIDLCDLSHRNHSPYIPVYGSEALEWAIKADFNIETIFISESHNIPSFICETQKTEILYISEFLNKKITNLSHVLDLCALVCKKDENIYTVMNNKENIVILDQVLDHGNIGTIVRTMRCFGYNNMIFTNYEMDLYYKNIVNASRGEAFKVIHQSMEMNQLINILKNHDYKIYSTAANYSLNINDLSTKINDHYAIILGNETSGIDQKLLELSDIIIGCPMQNGIDSLNVGVAAGIIFNKMSLLSN